MKRDRQVGFSVDEEIHRRETSGCHVTIKSARRAQREREHCRPVASAIPAPVTETISTGLKSYQNSSCRVLILSSISLDFSSIEAAASRFFSHSICSCFSRANRFGGKTARANV